MCALLDGWIVAQVSIVWSLFIVVILQRVFSLLAQIVFLYVDRWVLRARAKPVVTSARAGPCILHRRWCDKAADVAYVAYT